MVGNRDDDNNNDDYYYIDQKGNKKYKIKKVDNRPQEKEIIHEKGIFDPDYIIPEPPKPLNENTASKLWGTGYDTPNYNPNCFKCNKDMKYAIPVYCFQKDTYWNAQILFYCPICFNNFIMAEVQNHIRKQTEKKELGL